MPVRPAWGVADLFVVPVVVALLAAQVGTLRTASGAELAEDGTPDEASGRLAQLLADYREYGLPLPPREAVLVRRRHGGSYVNGEQQFRYDLAWQEERSGKSVYWLGISTETGRATIEKLGPDPVAEVLDGRDNSVVVSRRNSSGEQDVDLLMAIQCHERGWSKFAIALLERSRLSNHSSWFEKPPRRFTDDREQLALVAWNYWSDEFAIRTFDRAAAVARLKSLAASRKHLGAAAQLNLIADMESTLVATRKNASEFEAAIDGLVELGRAESREAWQRPTIGSVAHKSKEYRMLAAAGLEAVPALIEHLSDRRVTRCVETSRRGEWRARVSDVVATLLSGLATEPFAYDFLLSQGRGKELDRAHVLHWWAGLEQNAKSLEYLKSHAIQALPSGDVEVSATLLRAMGRRFPDELLRLFKEKVDVVENPAGLISAVQSCAAPREKKIAALLDAAKNPVEQKRYLAIDALLDLKSGDAVSLLVKELDALPKTPKTPYWGCGAGTLAQLVSETADELAWKTLARAARRVDVGQRMEMLQSASVCGESDESERTRVLGFLAEFLNDEEIRIIPDIDDDDLFSAKRFAANETRPLSAGQMYEGPVAGFVWERLAVRDFAALQVADVLNLEFDRNGLEKPGAWAELRALVAKALKERGPRKEARP